jgi:hypothetical protein
MPKPDKHDILQPTGKNSAKIELIPLFTTDLNPWLLAFHPAGV